jgi:hypothetical protein
VTARPAPRRAVAGVALGVALGAVGGLVPTAAADPAPHPTGAPATPGVGTPAPHPPVTERARLEVQPAGKPLRELTIVNPLGDVRIEGYDGAAIVIETRKQAPDAATLDRLRISLVPNPDGTVRISTTADPAVEAAPVARRQVRVDLLIRAPRAARIDAEVGAGRLEVLDMDGGGELDAAAGPISVHNVAGALQAHSVSGALSLAQVFGSVDAQTVTADVDLDGIGGERLIASAHRGHIVGRRVRSRELTLTTTEGDIDLDGEAALEGHLVVSSLRGDVTVRLRRRGALAVRARGRTVTLGRGGAPRPDPAGDPGAGWTAATYGDASEHPALLELRSRFGAVQFTIVP